MNNLHTLTPSRLLVVRLAIIAGGIVLMVLLANNLSRPDPVAKAITAGMNRPYPLNDIDAQDQNLQGDEQEARAMWARAHPGAKAEDCPGSLRDFHVGCVAALHER